MPNIKELAARFGVSEEDAKVYIREFHVIDANKDGKISVEELKTGLNSFGCTVTLEEAKKMVQFADTNRDNKIDLDEFLTVITTALKSKKASIEEEALQAFAVFDTNQDGFISMSELRATMAKLGQPLSDKAASEIIKLYDKNKDGLIDHKEFLAAWKHMTGQK